MRAATHHQVPTRPPHHPASRSGRRTASSPLVRPPRRLHPVDPAAAPPGQISTQPAAIRRRRASRRISLTSPVRDFETRGRRNPRSPTLLGWSLEAVVKFLGSPMSPVRPVRRPLRRRDLQHSGATTTVAFSLCTRIFASMHGSIEYWPDPQRGIREAYRVLSADGVACMIGPVRPTFWLSRFFADMWMLFPTEEEYIEWFERAGFKDVELTRIGPKWYRGARRHGLIIGCCVTGIKTQSGDSPLQLGPKVEDVSKPHVNPIFVFFRFLIGTICATYFFLVPIYMWIKDKIVPQGRPI